MCYNKTITEERTMGMVHAEITLKNATDEGNAQSGLIKPKDIRTATVTAVVDTGAMHLVINEELREKLGLRIKEERYVLVANGQRVRSKVTDAVEVHWKNRATVVQAVVIPDALKVLLGAIALEGMDLMVNPVTQEVVGVHGEEELHYAL
jgi:clan AA aspartic protease